MTGSELLGARRIRQLLDRHRVMLTKSLGQNFVVDPNTIRKVVDVAGTRRKPSGPPAAALRPRTASPTSSP